MSASRWNSLKHGLLIREALIPVGEGKGDRAQLLGILKRFRRGLDIRGLAEEPIVERLAVIYWQMRRNDIGEIGELRLFFCDQGRPKPLGRISPISFTHRSRRSFATARIRAALSAAACADSPMLPRILRSRE